MQMSRVAEMKKAEKIQANLHMIDLPKGNNHIKFIGSFDEIKNQK